jgi:hypothetical protein
MAQPLQILRRYAHKSPPPPGAPGIFALADAQKLKALLRSAGFQDVTIRTMDETFQIASSAEAVQMIKDAFGVYRATIGDQPTETQQAAWAEVTDFLKGFEGADGLRVPAQFHVIGAVKPT